MEENGSCRAAFCESAVQRGIKLPQSPTATAPSETEGVLSAEGIPNRLTQPKGRCTVRCSGLCFPHFYFAVLIKLRLSHRYLMPEMAVTAATSQHRAMEITTTMETLSTVPR